MKMKRRERESRDNEVGEKHASGISQIFYLSSLKGQEKSISQ